MAHLIPNIKVRLIADESLRLVQNPGENRLAFEPRIDYRISIQLAPLQLAGKFLSEGITHFSV
jgi:hypothetical protein